MIVRRSGEVQMNVSDMSGERQISIWAWHWWTWNVLIYSKERGKFCSAVYTAVHWDLQWQWRHYIHLRPETLISKSHYFSMKDKLFWILSSSISISTLRLTLRLRSVCNWLELKLFWLRQDLCLCMQHLQHSNCQTTQSWSVSFIYNLTYSPNLYTIFEFIL